LIRPGTVPIEPTGSGSLAFEPRLRGDEPAPRRITSREVLEYATIEGARPNGLEDKVGSLTPGKEADMILLRTDRVNVMPIDDPIGAVLWGMDTGSIDSVFIAGKVMKRGGELVDVDLIALKTTVTGSRDYVLRKARFKPPPI